MQKSEMNVDHKRGRAIEHLSQQVLALKAELTAARAEIERLKAELQAERDKPCVHDLATQFLGDSA